MRFDRTDTSVFGRWWWTVDRLNISALLLLSVIGVLLVTAGSPSVARHLDLPQFHFVHRHYMFLIPALVMMLVISMLSPLAIRRLAVVGFIAALVLMILIPFLGSEIKGAQRWIRIGGWSLQPSEFMKPFFAVVTAWVCTENHKRVDFPGYRISIALYVFVVLLLISQPDIGMTITITVVWGIQLFVAGLPMLWVGFMGVIGVIGLFTAYYSFDHVAKRINSFLDPSSGGNYQISRSLEAFRNGGLLGRGPGEGDVKQSLPDSHTDFIFAVAGEEFGVIACLLIIGLFAFILLRGFSRLKDQNDLFVVLAVTGVLTQFGAQTVINMGVSVNLLPAKGMTLPFLSYGGSSIFAIAMGMGIMLALTRRQYGKQRR